MINEIVSYISFLMKINIGAAEVSAPVRRRGIGCGSDDMDYWRHVAIPDPNGLATS